MTPVRRCRDRATRALSTLKITAAMPIDDVAEARKVPPGAIVAGAESSTSGGVVSAVSATPMAAEALARLPV